MLKPVQEGARGERELEFFRTLAATTDPAVARCPVLGCVVLYYCSAQVQGGDPRVPRGGGAGRAAVPLHGEPHPRLQEALHHGHQGQWAKHQSGRKENALQWCVGQVGARTWGPDASPEKQESQDRSYAATKEPFGFSVPGLSVHTGPDRQQVGSDIDNSPLGKPLTAQFTVIFLGGGDEGQGVREAAEC